MNDILQINVNKNLTEGLIVKNYKEMCNLLGEESKGGKSKQLQLSDWQRYFDYDKRGNSFVVTEIYNIPLEKEDNRGKSEGSRDNNSIYIPYIETLLLHLLAQQDDQTLVCTKNYLLVALGMTNIKYTSQTSREILLKVKSFTKHELKDFDNRAYQTLNRILFTSLDNLKRKCLIDYYDELHYKKINDEGNSEEYIATDDERRKYMDIKREILTEWNYKELRDIYFHDRVDEFYSELIDRMYDIYQWDRAFVSYHILFNKTNIINFIPMLEKNLNQTQIKQSRIDLNCKVVDALNNNAITKYKNMLEKFKINLRYLPPEDYIERQYLIAEELVRISDDNTMQKAI